MKLLDALRSAKESDLADVEARIAELDQELDALKTARKLLQQRFSCAPKKSAGRGEPDDQDPLDLIERALREAVHPLMPGQIAAATGIHCTAVGRIVRGDNRFRVGADKTIALR